MQCTQEAVRYEAAQRGSRYALCIDRIERRAGHRVTVLKQPGELWVVGANRQWRNALDDDIAKAHNQLQRTNWGYSTRR
jgi:hypothetical protein